MSLQNSYKPSMRTVVCMQMPTRENRERWEQEVNEANFKLRMFAYILYEKIQAEVYNLKSELEKIGIYGIRDKTVKHGRNYDKDLSRNVDKAVDAIRRLCNQVKADERLTVLKRGLAPFPVYIHEFGNEGSVFALTAQRFAGEETREQQMYLKVAISNLVINCKELDESIKPSAQAIISVKSYYTIMDSIRLFLIDSLAHIPLRRECLPKKSIPFTDLGFALDNIFKYLLGNVPEAEDKYQDAMLQSIEGIGRRLGGNRMYEHYADALIDTFSNYIHFAVASMILKVRNGKDLKLEEDAKYLRENFGFTDEDIDTMQKEFKKTRIDIRNADAYDIKDYVPLMKNAPMTKKLIDDFMYVPVYENKKENDNRTGTNG